jgi:hypothetical protein
MIQRLQTIWWLIAMLLLVLTIFLPYGQYSSLDASTQTALLKSLNTKTNFVATLITAIGIACAGFAIFLFKNRSLQKLISLLGATICLAIAAYEFYLINNTYKGGTYNIGIALPLLSFSFFVIARIYVAKDEKLLRSIDRLRD